MRPSQSKRRLLIRGVNWLGDAVMSTPALLRVREAHPDWEITMLTRGSLADLWHQHRAIDDVITFSKSDSVASVARRLRSRNFDVALALPNSIRSALELWFARIPERIGYSVNPLRRFLLTTALPQRADAIPMQKKSSGQIRRLTDPGRRASRASESARPIPPEAHHIFHYLHLAASLSANPEPVPPAIEVIPNEIEQFRRKWQLPPDIPMFGLNPGAEYGPAKRWPAQNFIDAAVEIQKKVVCRWIVFGGPGDVTLAEQITNGINAGLSSAIAPSATSTSSPVLNLAGRTSLRDLCVGFKLCRILLTNDTGPMHVGAAVGTPVIVPFGSTSPELTGPGLPGTPPHVILRSNAPCSPCFLRTCPIDFRCMHGITVEQVVNAALQSS